MYKIESIAGKGKGAIASRDIEPGTRILRETAVMVIWQDKQLEKDNKISTPSSHNDQRCFEETFAFDKGNQESVEKRKHEETGRHHRFNLTLTANSFCQLLQTIFHLFLRLIVGFWCRAELRETVAIVEAFKKMPLEQHDAFFKLADVHSKHLLTNIWLENQWELGDFGQDLTKEDVAKILGTVWTNRFHNGIYLEMSRFNHSCGPNAEYFLNDDANARDLVAIKRIEKDEEIYISYLPTDSSTSIIRKQRQSHLFHTYCFDCNCQICSLTANELEEDEANRTQFMELQYKYWSPFSTLSTSEKLVNLNLQLKLVPKCHVKIMEVLQNILDEAYEVACQDSFIDDEVIFEYTEKGKEYAILLFGQEDHPVTEMWKRRHEKIWKKIDENFYGLDVRRLYKNLDPVAFYMALPDDVKKNLLNKFK